MSAYWLYVILKNGLGIYLTFTKPAGKKGFSGFGNAMAAEEKTKKVN